jgi:hypothetical protein
VRRRAILMMPIRHEQRRWPAFTKGAGDAINSGRVATAAGGLQGSS